MINVMISFAEIAREVSSRIYIRRKTLAEKAAAASELDARLVQWRDNLPGYLHKDRNSLRQPEFVNKQSNLIHIFSDISRDRIGTSILSPSPAYTSTFSRCHRRIKYVPGAC